MQMLFSDWPSNCTLSAISVQRLELVYKMTTGFRFAKVVEETFDENG